MSPPRRNVLRRERITIVQNFSQADSVKAHRVTAQFRAVRVIGLPLQGVLFARSSGGADVLGCCGAAAPGLRPGSSPYWRDEYRCAVPSLSIAVRLERRPTPAGVAGWSWGET